MRKTLEARLFKGGKVMKIQELGRVNVDEYGRISSNVYRKNTNKITMKACAGEYIHIYCKETDKMVSAPPCADFVKIV